MSEYVIVEQQGPFVTLTLNRPEKRNALSREMMTALTNAFVEAGRSQSLGIVLKSRGSVFSAGHDFADMAGSDIKVLRALFEQCSTMMETIQSVPQPVIAMVGGLATAAGCQLVATCDLAVAASSAGFATPGGKGGLFCHTPMVAIARNIGRKRTFELSMTGDVISAADALEWGLVNRVVEDDELESATFELLRRATRGSSFSKSLGKSTLYAQLDMNQRDAYRYATETMASAASSDDAQEAIAAFFEKRAPKLS